MGEPKRRWFGWGYSGLDKRQAQEETVAAGCQQGSRYQNIGIKRRAQYSEADVQRLPRARAGRPAPGVCIAGWYPAALTPPIVHPTSTDISVDRQVATEFLPTANTHKEKMVNIISYQGNANSDQTGSPLTTHRLGYGEEVGQYLMLARTCPLAKPSRAVPRFLGGAHNRAPQNPEKPRSTGADRSLRTRRVAAHYKQGQQADSPAFPSSSQASLWLCSAPTPGKALNPGPERGPMFRPQLQTKGTESGRPVSDAAACLPRAWTASGAATVTSP